MELGNWSSPMNPQNPNWKDCTMKRSIRISCIQVSGQLNQYGKECIDSGFDTGRSDGSGSIEISCVFWKATPINVTLAHILIEVSCPDDMGGHPYPNRSDKSLIEDATEMLQRDFFK